MENKKSEKDLCELSRFLSEDLARGLYNFLEEHELTYKDYHEIVPPAMEIFIKELSSIYYAKSKKLSETITELRSQLKEFDQTEESAERKRLHEMLNDVMQMHVRTIGLASYITHLEPRERSGASS